MKIAMFGTSGTIGQRIVQEALRRGHHVRAIARHPSHQQSTSPNLTVQEGNVLNPASIAQNVAGQDAVISAIGPTRNAPPDIIIEAAHALLAGLKQANVRRLIVVNGAGSLEVAPGLQLVDTPDFPTAWRPLAVAHNDALSVYRANSDLDWTVVSPAAFITPGERTGHYRTGTDQLLSDKKGESRISAEDYAVALIDELENPHFIRHRFTVAY